MVRTIPSSVVAMMLGGLLGDVFARGQLSLSFAALAQEGS
jgi:hypothetical protein